MGFLGSPRNSISIPKPISQPMPYIVEGYVSVWAGRNAVPVAYAFVISKLAFGSEFRRVTCEPQGADLRAVLCRAAAAKRLVLYF